jgi:ATP-dependent Clp protease ATP-binding subunit ClpX
VQNKTNHNCDFCGTSKEDVEKLIVGESAAICSDCIDLCTDILKDDKIKKFPTEEQNKIYNPVLIKDYLDSYIIGQDDAKVAISVAVCQHFKRVNNPDSNIQIEKTNVLLLGPTGCGKTLMAKRIANYLDLPFAICDATGLTESGYVGDDVESILVRLLSAADGDVEKAEHGIVYIDEIDKLARKGESMSITRDVSGEGVQQGLLKMIEGSIMRVPSRDKRKHPKGDMLEIDTSKILFICGGAFVGLDKIISRRTDANSIGFHSKISKTENVTVKYKDVTTKDLITYGMIPEFVGRFGLITSVDELSVEQLVGILKEPKNSLISQYQYLFQLDGIELDFDKDSFISIAERAKELKTNARGLKNILEKTLLTYQFEAINLVARGLTKIIISKDTVEGKPAKMIFDKQPNEKSKQKV